MKLRSRAHAPAVVVAACLFAAGSAAAFGACIPAYTFGENGAGSEGGSDHDATTGGGDATTEPDGAPLPLPDGAIPPGPDGSSGGSDGGADGGPGTTKDASMPSGDAGATFAIASTAGNTVAAGYGYQLHVIYAENDGRYWLFYADGTAGVIKTRVSSNFTTWTDAASIALTPGYAIADGYAFSVAYANLGGTDVVHIVENSVSASEYQSFNIRATIAGGVLTAASPAPLPDTDSSGSQGSSGSTCPNDGPSTVIGSDGHVWDVTAWTGHPVAETTCDTNIYESPATDTGSSWNNGAFVHNGYYVSLPSYSYSHELVSLPDAGTVMIVYPDQDNLSYTMFDSIGWALSPTFSGGGPGTTGVEMPQASELFNGTSNQASLNDWASCHLTDQDIHVMRHVITSPGNSSSTTDTAFEEVAYGGSTWTTATPPASVISALDSGLALVSDTNAAHGFLAVVIGTDDAIHIAKYTTAAGWTQLPSIPGASPRQSLSGTGCGSVKPAVFWTEGSGPPYSVMAVDLSGLL